MSGDWGTGTPTASDGLASVQSCLRQLDGKCSSLKASADRIGTPGDTSSLRQEISTLRQAGDDLCSNASAELNTLSASTDKTRFERLNTQFNQLQDRWRGLARDVSKKASEHSVAMEVASSLTPSESKTQQFAGIQLRDVTLAATDADSAIIAERNKEMKGLAEDLGALQEVFQDTHNIVVEQGQDLDHVQNDTSISTTRTREAAEHLEEAEQHACGLRVKILICLVVSLIILCVVAVGIVAGVTCGFSGCH